MNIDILTYIVFPDYNPAMHLAMAFSISSLSRTIMDARQAKLSDIQRFYKDTTVFLTGATGFIGKLFLEKVLRALPVKKVFILVREKKNVPPTKRFQDILKAPIFEPLKRSNPQMFDKVTIMEGDVSLPQLGLSHNDMETFIQEVDVVFHCAATVRFQEHIKKATMTNIRGTKVLIDLAKKVKKLKTFVYVGTAYSNSPQKEIKETVYPPKMAAEGLINLCEGLDEACLDSMTETLVGDWPNTYTLTKHITEDYIKRAGKDIPICITRPTIVISTSAEPLHGYVDNVYTLAGFVLANAMGVSRITYYRNTIADLVPADYVVNACIAAGWYTGESFKGHHSEIPVYNISSGQDNPIRQDEVYGLCDYYCREVPTPNLVTYPIYFRTTCKYNYLVLRFLFHTLIAHIIDLVSRIQGKQPVFVDGIKKLHSFQEVFEHFTTIEFYIHVDNMHKLLKRMSFQDRELFNCDLRTLNWNSYFYEYIRGMRFYLLKEPMDNIPEGFKRYRYLKRVMIVTMIFVAIFLYVVGKIFLFRVLPFVLGIIAYILRGLVC